MEPFRWDTCVKHKSLLKLLKRQCLVKKCVHMRRLLVNGHAPLSHTSLKLPKSRSTFLIRPWLNVWYVRATDALSWTNMHFKCLKYVFFDFIRISKALVCKVCRTNRGYCRSSFFIVTSLLLKRKCCTLKSGWNIGHTICRKSPQPVFDNISKRSKHCQLR